MKSSQTAVLLVVIVVMVFAVTFASMYVRQLPKDTQAPPKDEGGPVLSLTFASDRHPVPLDDMRNRVVTEFGRKGHHEFWFRNDNDQEVRLGMNRKNCTCSEVLVYLLPEAWQKELATPVAGYPLAWAVSTAVAEERIRRRVERLPDSEFTHLDEGGRNSFKVPPGARGVVRLIWEARRVSTSPHPTVLQAELWASHQRNLVELQVGALFVDAVRLDKTDIAVGAISPGTPARGEVRCWTALYPSFRVEVTADGGPFVEVGELQPLTDADRAELSGWGGRVKAGYRIPVQLRERTDSGKPVPLGPFQYTLTVKPFVKDDKEEIALETQHVTFRGVVRGDVVVIGAENGIRLETFRASEGIVHQAELTTDRTDVDLRLVSAPKFMKVKLDKQRPGTSGRPHWSLTVEIPPGAVEGGAFPRPGLEAYRDCTILLRIGGEDGRDFRVPVSGIARR